jgi:hypothetical protein
MLVVMLLNVPQNAKHPILWCLIGYHLKRCDASRITAILLTMIRCPDILNDLAVCRSVGNPRRFIMWQAPQALAIVCGDYQMNYGGSMWHGILAFQTCATTAGKSRRQITPLINHCPRKRNPRQHDPKILRYAIDNLTFCAIMTLRGYQYFNGSAEIQLS